MLNNTKKLEMTFNSKISGIDEAEWSSLLSSSDSPFISYRFLKLLEDTGCVGQDTGWEPLHATLREADSQKLIGAIPLYIKHHSYGEYVFDWGWAQAYQEHGLNYYPKLLCAIPFTPASCRKILCLNEDLPRVGSIFLDQFKDLCSSREISSIHALFLNKEEQEAFSQASFANRVDNQFHWHNNGYQNFNDFLNAFTSKKRKNIRQERRRIEEQNLTFQWLIGDEASEDDWRQMYQMYLRTIGDHGGMPYLKEDFFLQLPAYLGSQVMLLQGKQDQNLVCSALYFASSSTLYGRYWGSTRFFSNMHFEACYYQPIEFAIKQGLTTFEAGAQGIHKLSRGLTPTPTYSAHWLAHEGFNDAVQQFLSKERTAQERFTAHLDQSIPFRKNTLTFDDADSAK